VATIERHLAAPRDAVWAILTDASSYSDWFLNLADIRNISADWPAPGSGFDHKFRWGPIRLPGHTRVLEAQPPGHLTVRMKQGLLALTTIELLLQHAGDSTDLQMRHTRDAIGVPLLNPLLDQVLTANYVTSLSRLERLAQRRASRSRSGH